MVRRYIFAALILALSTLGSDNLLLPLLVSVGHKQFSCGRLRSCLFLDHEVVPHVRLCVDVEDTISRRGLVSSMVDVRVRFQVNSRLLSVPLVASVSLECRVVGILQVCVPG